MSGKCQICISSMLDSTSIIKKNQKQTRSKTRRIQNGYGSKNGESYKAV